MVQFTVAPPQHFLYFFPDPHGQTIRQLASPHTMLSCTCRYCQAARSVRDSEFLMGVCPSA